MPRDSGTPVHCNGLVLFKTDNKKPVFSFETLLQNELNGDVARFITHLRTCLACNKSGCKDFYVGGKTRNIAIELVWSKVAKQVARFLLLVSSVP